MINLKKNDPVADTIKQIIEKELSPKQKRIAALAGDKNAIDALDLAALRAGKKPVKEEETVEEGWDEMLADVKKRSGPQPSGGSGVKLGSRYGGGKQKEKPEQEEPKEKKEETSYFKERLIERAMLKMAAKKAFKALTGGSDEDQRKDLQRKMGVPQTGKKPESKNEEVEIVYEANIEPTSAKSRSHISNLSNPTVNSVTHQGKQIGLITKQPSGEYHAHHSAAKLAHAQSGTFDTKDKAHQFIRNAHANAIKSGTLSNKFSKANEEAEPVQEVAPPGFEGTVRAMKKHKDITNPFALAWSMKNKGYKSHKKADGSDK